MRTDGYNRDRKGVRSGDRQKPVTASLFGTATRRKAREMTMIIETGGAREGPARSDAGRCWGRSGAGRVGYGLHVVLVLSVRSWVSSGSGFKPNPAM